MLPIGRLSKRGPKGPERDSWFTPDERKTLMTLWTIFGSPLMFGGALVDLDEATRNLLTNDAVLAVGIHGAGGSQLLREDPFCVWTAGDSRDESVRYVALFNLGDEPLTANFVLSDHGLPTGSATDLWTGEAVALAEGSFVENIEPHGCVYLKLS
jgi:hypothetical protein